MKKFKNKNTINPWPESINVYGWDKPRRPKSKLPDCPNCGEDELSMLAFDNIFCNKCGTYFEPKD